MLRHKIFKGAVCHLAQYTPPIYRQHDDFCRQTGLVRRFSTKILLSLHPLKKYYTQTGDQEDLISIGTIGLIKGISTYKPDKGVRLATYASRCIENEILMYFRSIKKTANDISLSESIDTDGESNSLSLLDVVSVEDDILEELGADELTVRLRELVAQLLSERERDIIVLRYGLGGKKPLTQRETAEKCGISRSYVSRIEKKALEKLKAQLELEDFVS